MGKEHLQKSGGGARRQDASPGRSLAPPPFQLQSSAPIQRVIKDKKKQSLTWNQARQLGGDEKTAFEGVVAEVGTRIGGGFELSRLEKAWNNLNKGKKDLSLDDPQTLVEGLVGAYQRSAKSSQGHGVRKDFNLGLMNELNEGRDEKFVLEQNAQTAKLRLENMPIHAFDEDMTMDDRFERHVSTLMLTSYGGIESQTSLKMDGGSMFISTNQDKSNNVLGGEIKDAFDLFFKAQDYLVDNKFPELSLDEINQNRIMRHVAKIFRGPEVPLRGGSKVMVPERDKKRTKDGKHSELRIVDDTRWKKEEFLMPKGTRYPCGCCFESLSSKGLDPGDKMGPIWTACASLHNQLQKYNNGVIDTNQISDKEKFWKALKEHLGEAEEVGKMGWGKHRDGSDGDDYDADSEVEDDITERERKEIIGGLPPSFEEWLRMGGGRKKKKHRRDESKRGGGKTDRKRKRESDGKEPKNKKKSRKR